MKIVDPHHHLWDLDELNYPWLNAGGGEVAFGNYAPLCKNYHLADFLADHGKVDVVKSVNIQAEHDRSDPVRETAWLQNVADQSGNQKGLPSGIVAFADFEDPSVDDMLAKQKAHKNVRGIRHVVSYQPQPDDWDAPKNYFADATWRQNIGLLAKHDLHFELQIYAAHQSEPAVALMNTHPNVQFILTHTGNPVQQDDSSFDNWLAGLKQLATCENAVLKVSGLGMYMPKWTLDMLRPYVINAIEVFGPQRCMFGSNFPVDGLFSTYEELYAAFFELTSDFSEDERNALFHDNAIKYYRL